MKKLLFFVAVSLMTVSLQAARCAVLAFESAASISIAQVDGIDAMFMTYFHPAGYTMVDRHDFEVLIEEQGLQSSDLTTDQMVQMGRILNVSKIVRGTVSMLGGFYQVDVRVIDVETSTYISDGTTFRGDNYRDNVKNLATSLAAKVAIRPGSPIMPSPTPPSTPTPPTPPSTPAPPIPTPIQPEQEPYVLYGYLKVFPKDLGTFETEPKTIIARLNQNKQYGYGTWRLPTNEELALMKANNIIGNSNNYMTQERPTGIVRLVTDKEKEDTISVAPAPIAHQNFVETASDLNMQMIWVEGGEFIMGCTTEQRDAYGDCFIDAMNVHRVTLGGFYIGMLEVTQAQWEKIMGTTINQQRQIAEGNSLPGDGDDYPMYYVTWEEANEFCRRLSRLTNKSYTLPTEAQWEYAARGGQNHDGTKYAGSNMLDAVGWYRENSVGERYCRSHTCGTKRANSLGIYDLSGNVYEWCKDWYTDSYMTYVTNNPEGPASGDERVIRGGSYRSTVGDCQVSYRSKVNPNYRVSYIGFRVVLIP